MSDGGGESRWLDRGKRAEARRPALEKRCQGGQPIVVQIAALDRPALRVDRCKAVAAREHHGEPRPEVLDLLVAEMTDDLDGRPLGGRGPRAPGRRIEIGQQSAEHRGEPRQLASGDGENVAGIVHASTPPSWTLYSPRILARKAQLRGHSRRLG